MMMMMMMMSPSLSKKIMGDCGVFIPVSNVTKLWNSTKNYVSYKIGTLFYVARCTVNFGRSHTHNLVGMSCRVAGSVYDFLGSVHPSATAPHDGMKFSTTGQDNDLLHFADCASILGGGWWYTEGSTWTPTTVAPVWHSLGDDTWYPMQKCHLMVKLQ